MAYSYKETDQLRKELEELRLRVSEAEEALEAIRNGEVDALVVYGNQGEQVFTLQGAEHPYRVMVENINEGAASMSQDGVVLYANPQLARLLKAPPETVLGYPFQFFVSPNERNLFEALLELGGRLNGRAEITLQSLDGSTLPAMLSVSPLQDPDLPGVCMVVTDLSEQKRNAEILAAERMAASIIAQAAEAIVVCDRSGKIIRASQSAYALARNNLLHQQFGDALPLVYEEVKAGKYRFSLEAILGGAQVRGLPAYLEIPSPDGEGKWKAHLLVSATPLTGAQGEILGCIVSMTDVNDRRRAENQARFLAMFGERIAHSQEPEEIIRITLDSLGEFLGLDICQLDEVSQDKNLIVVHSEYRRSRGPAIRQYRLSEFSQNIVAELQAGQPVVVSDASIDSRTQPGYERLFAEFGIQAFILIPQLREGDWVGTVLAGMRSKRYWREDEIAVLKSVVSRLWLALEKARLIQNLRESEERLAYQALVLENVHDAVIASDNDLRITSWNRAAEAMYGWRAEEVLGKKVSQLLRSEMDHEKRQQLLQKVAEGTDLSIEVVHFTRDDRQLWIDGRTISLHDKDGGVIGFVSANRDITERKQMEASLLQSQADLERRVQERTQELSLKNTELAEMNAQLLAEIAERMRVERELEETRRRLGERVEAERIRLSRELHDGPIQDLFAVSFLVKGIEYDLAHGDCASQPVIERMVAARQGMVQVVQVLREVCGELRPPTLVPYGLEKTIRSYTLDFAQDHPEIQVRLELNADAQALPENVRLALFRILQQSMSNVFQHAQASQVTVRFQFDAEEVLLEVSDDGRGFEVPERWIEFARQGYLGLVGSAERADALGGELKVISAPGEGTKVRVVIPRTW